MSLGAAAAAAPEPDPRPAASLPAFVPWALAVLLVVPFHPFWIDFEQVRRGVLLALAGAVLLLRPALAAVRGERAWLWFLLAMALSALVNLHLLQPWDDPKIVRLLPWDAVYRLAHWIALLFVLRLGAAAKNAFAGPFAVLLLATSAFGLLQRLGLGEVCGYGTADEPVSVFGNANVASEWTAVAAVAVAVLQHERAWLWRAALAAAGAYLAVNGSRSGLIALPVGLLALWAMRRATPGSWLPLALAAGGAAAGLALAAAAPLPPPTTTAAAAAVRDRGIATLEVRWEIARASATLFAEAPLLGHGPGQFAVHYPRVRSQDEIEASSHGRQFRTEVRTAHDDWLELLLEGGLPGIVLFAAAMLVLQQHAADKARLLPLLALLLLMLVRSPLANAPAAAAAMLLAGVPAAAPRAASAGRSLALRGLGLLLVALGAVPVLAHSLFAPHVAALRAGRTPPRTAADRAAAVMPFEPRWLQMQAQQELADGDLAAASAHAARASRLRPFDPYAYLLVAEILAKGNKLREAQDVAEHALRLDPPNPELRVLLSTVWLQAGMYDEAVEVVCTEPHPTLRARLVDHFRDLGRLAQRRSDDLGAARCTVEHEFLQALETLGKENPAAHVATGERVRTLLPAMKRAGLHRKDLRGHVTSALHALDLGQPETCELLAREAKALGVKLPAWQRGLLGAHLERLQRFESWFDVLRAK